MNNYKTLRVVTLWLVLVSSDTVAQLMLKSGAVKSASSGWSPSYLILTGYSLYIVSFVVWMQILKNTRLFIAISATSLLYITIPFASHIVFAETLSAPLLIGSLFIAAGVLVLGLRGNL